MKKMDCLRCGTEMKFAMREKIQLGEAGFVFRDLSHLLSGAMSVDVYVCPRCKKIELYSAESLKSEDLPKRTCPECGDEHDFDYPKCPKCKHNYYAE